MKPVGKRLQGVVIDSFTYPQKAHGFSGGGNGLQQPELYFTEWSLPARSGSARGSGGFVS